MDPLEFFPAEISEIIFKNLDGNDLVAASAVSTSWHNYVANQKDFQKKVKVKFLCNYNRGDYDDILVSLMRTEKTFENIEVHCCWRCLYRIIPFLHQHKWKTVTVRRSSFTTAVQASEFFECIQSNVEVLDIAEIYVKDTYCRGPNKAITFPKLKVFNSRHTQSFLYCEIFNFVSTLTELRLYTSNFCSEGVESIFRMFKNNVNLRVLEITGTVSYKIFFRRLEKFGCFKLTDVKISEDWYVGENEQDRIFANFLDLMRHQENLKSITFNKWMEEDFLLEVLQLPISKLNIESEIPAQSLQSWELNDIKVNTSIKSLNIRTYHPRPAMKIIRKLPNLSHLSCNYADEKFIEFLQENAKNLKSLSIELLNITDFSKFQILKDVKLTVPYYISSMKGLPESLRKK